MKKWESSSPNFSACLSILVYLVHFVTMILLWQNYKSEVVTKAVLNYGDEAGRPFRNNIYPDLLNGFD